MRGKNPYGHIYIVYSSTIEHLPSTHETVGFIPSTVSIYFYWGVVPYTQSSTWAAKARGSPGVQGQSG